MISIDNLGVEFSARPLFAGISYVVNDRDRIALVGKNGAGKSTMLKIIAGVEVPTEGVVSVPRDVTVGYLPQVMVLSDGCTVREEAEKAFANITELQGRIVALQGELARREDYESEGYMRLCEEFTHATEHLEMMGGSNYQANLERTLTGLGFERRDMERPTSEFSGGWRMRIELAKLLLQHPDVLLLDEPTNHLDIESIQWLEQFLSSYAGAVMLVSHDRAFINNVTNRTLEISCGRVYDYKVRYDEYVNLRAERREQQLRAYENQQREIADSRAFIGRFRYQATKAIQVQQRVRQLERIIPIEVDEVDNSALHLKFTCSQRSGDYPVICEDARKVYDRVVFDHVNLTIKRGEIRTKIRDILGAFMFGGEASDKKVKVLSGGERTRLAMIKLLLEPVNLLILDEPTNHLDMRSKDVLKEAIRDFDGTVIIVSHDRDFLDGLVERVYEFKGGGVREHLGGIYDWIRRHEAEQVQSLGAAPARVAAEVRVQSASKLSYEEQKRLARERSRMERAVKDAEAEVAELEQAIRILEASLATAEGSQDMGLYEKHGRLKQQLERAEEKWTEAMERLEEQLGTTE